MPRPTGAYALGGPGSVFGWIGGRNLDILHLLFPNNAGESVQPEDNVCFIPRCFTFPLLRNLTEYFLLCDLVNGIVVLLLCFLITVGMIVTKVLWCWLNPCFASVTPLHMHANSGMLFQIFHFWQFLSWRRYWVGIYNGFFEESFQVVKLKWCAIIYVASDLVALYTIPKLLKSTMSPPLLCMFARTVSSVCVRWACFMECSAHSHCQWML